MKKSILFLCLLASPFLLTGCGDKDEEESKASSNTKTLTCKADVSGLDTTIKIEYNTKKKSVNSAHAKYVMDLSSYSDTQKEAVKKTDLCSSFNQEYATDCKTSSTSDSITIDVELDVDYMIKTEFGGKEDMSLEDIQKGYENNLKAECSVK